MGSLTIPKQELKLRKPNQVICIFSKYSLSTPKLRKVKPKKQHDIPLLSIELNLCKNVTAAVEWHGRTEWRYISKKNSKHIIASCSESGVEAHLKQLS